MCHACPTNEPKVKYVKPPPPRREKLPVEHQCFEARRSKGYIRDPIIKKTVYVCESKPSLTNDEKKFHVKPYIKCYEMPPALIEKMDREGTNITLPENLEDLHQYPNCSGQQNNWCEDFNPYDDFNQPYGDPITCDQAKTKKQLNVPKTKVQMIQWKEYKEPPPPPPYRVRKVVKEEKKEIPENAECYNPIPIYCVHNNPLLVRALEERMKPNGPTNGPLPRFKPKYLCEKPEPIGKVLAHEYQKEWLAEREDLREQYYPRPCPPLNIKFVPCPSIERAAKEKILNRRVAKRPWYINFNIGNREADRNYYWLLKPCITDCRNRVEKTCSRNHK